jgi:hypothetical protein
MVGGSLSGGGVAPGPPAVPPVASSFGSELEVVILPPSSRRSPTAEAIADTAARSLAEYDHLTSLELELESWRGRHSGQRKRLLTRDTRNCRCGMDEE